MFATIRFTIRYPYRACRLCIWMRPSTIRFAIRYPVPSPTGNVSGRGDAKPDILINDQREKQRVHRFDAEVQRLLHRETLYVLTVRVNSHPEIYLGENYCANYLLHSNPQETICDTRACCSGVKFCTSNLCKATNSYKNSSRLTRRRALHPSPPPYPLPTEVYRKRTPPPPIQK